MAQDYDNTDWDNWEYDPNDDWTSSVKADEDEIIVKDAVWNRLFEWDTVAATKDLKVKGMKDIKRWDKFQKIRLTDDPLIIESWKMVLKTEFFKKI